MVPYVSSLWGVGWCCSKPCGVVLPKEATAKKRGNKNLPPILADFRPMSCTFASWLRLKQHQRKPILGPCPVF